LGGPSFSTVITTDDGNFGIVAVTDVVNAPGDRSYLTMADSPVVLKEIRQLKEQSTAVAVYIHWGRELLPVPTDRMVKLARTFIKAGADIIVGTHPHVPGSVACVDGKPVVWSLGNFLFDQKYDATKKGAVLDCTIGNDDTLSCTLTAHETARYSYLPQISGNNFHVKENKELATCRPVVRRTWTGVFTKDKREKKLLLTRDRQKNGLSFFTLFDLATGRPEARTPPMPIMKVQPFDLNGDGILEVMLIQNIYSPFDRETAKRLYLYSFADNFHALWRGSALARPLLDAIFVRRKNGKPFLAALHSADSYLLRKPDSMERLVMFYRWNGFGFSGVKEHRIENGSDGLVSDKVKLRVVTRGIVTSEIPMAQMISNP
jgi:poly-gamma-glutamate synthesis protein (capsule biosynthesis protein)